MWIWLENTSLAIWISETIWPYPIILSLHSVGLAIVVGIFLMRDLRLLGLFQGIDPKVFLPLGKLGWAGFAINAISGVLLFVAQAYTFVHSAPFLIKISCIALAMILAAVIQSRLRNTPDTVIASDISLKVLAGVSLSLWIGAIVAGRLIAYIY